MSEYVTVVAIRATPDTVWSILTDTAGYAAWNPEILAIDGRFARGERIKARVKVAGGAIRSVALRVTAFDTPSGMEWPHTAERRRRVSHAPQHDRPSRATHPQVRRRLPTGDRQFQRRAQGASGARWPMNPTRLGGRLTMALAVLVSVASHANAQSGSTTMSPAQPPGTMAPPANQPRATAGTGIVIGRVIDMTSGQPVGGAIVSIGSTAMTVTTNNFFGGPTIVTSMPGALDGSSKMSDLRVLTDAEGRFAFLDLPRGYFQFGVSATGYIGGAYGQRRPAGATQALELSDGQRIADVTLPVWKYGAMSGTITDEAGEPVVGVPITVLRRQIVAGRRRLAPSGQSAVTDDRGVYRIGMLVPGDYVVAVAVTQSSKSLSLVEEGKSGVPSALPVSVARANDPQTLPGSAGALQTGNAVLAISRGAVPPAAPPAGRILTYQTVFYPAARTPAEATVVAIGAGEDRGNVDLQLRLASTSRVSGTVSGPEGPLSHVPLRLVPAGLDDLSSETGFEAAATLTDASGAFSIVGVAPGQYVLRATQVPGSDGPAGRGGPVLISAPPSPTAAPPAPILYVNLPVAVGDADQSNLAVTMRPGARATGRVQFDGTKERPAPEAFKNFSVSIIPADARGLAGMNPRTAPNGFDASGQATTGTLAPGRYLLSAGGAPAGWTFKAALSNGRDISTTPLDVEGTDISGITFVFTDRTSEIAGTVQNATGNDGDATVLLFPADDHLWADNGGGTRRMKTMRVTKTGGFALTVVPEGEYFICAVRDDLVGDWPDPKFLESLRASATRVSIADGDRKTVNLRTVR